MVGLGLASYVCGESELHRSDGGARKESGPRSLLAAGGWLGVMIFFCWSEFF